MGGGGGSCSGVCLLAVELLAERLAVVAEQEWQRFFAVVALLAELSHTFSIAGALVHGIVQQLTGGIRRDLRVQLHGGKRVTQQGAPVSRLAVIQ